MKKIILALIIITWLTAFIENDNEKVFKKLYALEGTWKMNGKRGFIYEEWIKVNKDHLQNRGYIIKEGDAVVTERVALTNSKDAIFYTSTVEDQNDQKPIAFKLTASAGHKYVFENPAHDFPRRIVYRLISADSLHAFIDDGTETGKRMNFYYKKQ